jgi:hypothetical protein
LKSNLLKELADIDQIIEKLEARRTDIVNMLDVLKTLSTLLPFGTPLSDNNNLVGDKVVPIAVRSAGDGSK